MGEVTEIELMDAARAGRVLDCADAVDGSRRALDAALIRRCCRELRDDIDSRGIMLHNAAVVGRLDLSGIELPFPLQLHNCEFDEAAVADGGVFHALAVTDSPCLPGLLANGLRVRRDLDLSGSRVSGGHQTTASTSKRSAIWLCETDIGGRLLCVDTVIHADGERAIQADRMHVGGTVRFLHRFTARGEIRLLGARIDGSFDLTGAHLASPTGLALDLGDAVIGGSVFVIADAAGRRPLIEGRVDMGSARISGQLLIRSATLHGASVSPAGGGYSLSRAGGTSVSAPRLVVGAEMTLEDECQVSGGLDLSMSELSSLTVGENCSLSAPGRTALDLANAEMRSSLTFQPSARVQGLLRLTGARIHGNLTIQGVHLSEPQGRSLVAAQGVAVAGDVELQGLRATGGQLGFRAANLGSVVDAAGAYLDNPGDYTLNLHQATVKGSVRLVDGFQSHGVVVLNRAVVEGRLQCTHGSFHCPAPSPRNQHGHAIEAISATIRGGIDLGWESISPSVDFTNTRTTFLADDPARWPSTFRISGLTYDRFEQPQGSGALHTWDPAARAAWLTHQAAYDASPYEQAARIFRDHGYARQAEQILIAQNKQARRAITGRGTGIRRAGHMAYGLIVGYGYRPGRVLWVLATLLLLVLASLETPAGQNPMRATAANGIVYTTRGPASRSSAANPALRADRKATLTDACGNGKVRCFSPIFYAIDTVIPLVSLDQRSTWYPDPNAPNGELMLWWLNTATLLGWLLSTIFVLSLARLARGT